MAEQTVRGSCLCKSVRYEVSTPFMRFGHCYCSRCRKATGGVDVLGLHMALHGSTSFITRSLTFGWNRGRHGLAAPSTAAILSPFCYRCPVGKSFPSCDVQCLASSMELADANLTGKPAALIIEPIAGVYAGPASGNSWRIPDEDSLGFEFRDSDLFRPDRIRISVRSNWSADPGAKG